MPFKSKAQMRKFFALENEGKLPKGTAKKWYKETKSKLPEKKSSLYKKAFLQGILDFFTKEDKNTFNPDFSKVQEARNKLITFDDFIKKIEQDPSMTSEEKEQAKRKLLEQKNTVTSIPGISLLEKGLGYSGAALLASLVYNNIELSTPLKMLLAGATLISGGSLFSNILSNLNSKIINPSGGTYVNMLRDEK